ncbi:flagellar biosynthesis protein FlgN [Jhaorihella thermophila]|uniref:FlgN protein n=1 Tax=Jhaorihella thermophila TaxID=488547 RepID=A0A1H5U4F0_9RHOB|nr:flagellar biosynthesis protein FlgN [Jhaorihella thermophila]SEF69975.1 hypothetical protein SAMN05421751_103207 [Jhaorihella thermophila]
MANKTEATLERVNRLLDAERKALIEGRLDQLAELAERKSELVLDLEQLGDLNQQDLQEMRRKAHRNERLIQSALEGIRSVTARLETLRRVREGLETYDRSGNKTRITSFRDARMEKRA